MSKRIFVLAGAAMLFAGWAQAGETKAQVVENTTIAQSMTVQKEAPAPRADDAKTDAATSAAAHGYGQELPPSARPVYNNGGHFGGASGN